MDDAVRVVALDETAGYGWNLNIPQYLEPVAEEQTLSVVEAIQNLKHALNEAYAAEDHLKAPLIAQG